MIELSASSIAPTMPPTLYAAVKSPPLTACKIATNGRYTAMYTRTAITSRFRNLISSPSSESPGARFCPA